MKGKYICKIQLEILFHPLSSAFPAAGSLSIFCSTASRADESWMLFFVALWGLIGYFTWAMQFPGCFLRLLLLSSTKNLVFMWNGIKQGSNIRFLILKQKKQRPCNCVDFSLLWFIRARARNNSFHLGFIADHLRVSLRKYQDSLMWNFKIRAP